MNFHVLTLFPKMVMQGLDASILGRAVQKGHISLEAVNIRDYTVDKHGKADDYPYGGGAGMLMQAQPVYAAWQAVTKKIAEGHLASDNHSRKGEESRTPRVIYTTPQGRVFDQNLAEELAREKDLIFLCGHYEGIDERVLEAIVTDQVSIGDYVLTGGELPAMVMIDCISRLVPGVLKNEESAEYESFHDSLLEYPQYTRPEIWEGKAVPSVLLSGDHARVDRWRLEQAEERTRLRRPDLYEIHTREKKALAFLEKDRLGHMDMIEVIRKKQAEIRYADENGVLLYDLPSKAWMVSAADEDMGERLLSRIPRDCPNPLFAVHQPFLRDSICRRFGAEEVNACLQAVYTKKRPLPEPEGFTICVPDEAELPIIREAYGTLEPETYLLERIRSGKMLAIRENGKLAAFAGFHAEGSMGMLHVLEAYRGRGMATALETRLINIFLDNGDVPFCQIFEGNQASLALQRKLGLRLAPGRIYWIS